jgi:hypothetical protein
MQFSTPGLRRLTLVGLVAVGAVAGSMAVAFASSGDPATIRACVSNANGLTRITDSRCARYEHALKWDVKGPGGPQGTPGSAGAVSVQYPQQTFIAPTDSTSAAPAEAVLTCPTGTHVVNGVVLAGGTASYNLGSGYPDPARNAWVQPFSASDIGGPGQLTIRGVCVGS